MRAEAATAKTGKGGTTPVERLQELGVRGVLVQMAERGQIIELRCEMPKCYCHKGRAHFDRKSHPPGPWEPSPDHYPSLEAIAEKLNHEGVRTPHGTPKWSAAKVRKSFVS
jgi:hypothetical protein